MELPSARRTILLVRRLVRLRCPYCGVGAVLRRRGKVRDHCSACGFRYERSDENYFSGAVFVNYMMCGGIFAVALLVTLLLTWPNVPWDALSYGMPVAMVAAVIVLYPVSKVIWLTIDVLMRPITMEELDGRRGTS